MKKFYKIGPATLLLQDFPTNNIYPFALWKADAYTTAETEPDVTISYALNSLKQLNKLCVMAMMLSLQLQVTACCQFSATEEIV